MVCTKVHTIFKENVDPVGGSMEGVNGFEPIPLAKVIDCGKKENRGGGKEVGGKKKGW